MADGSCGPGDALAESTIDAARATNHALTLCYSPTFFGCPIALLVGDLATAELYVRMLFDHSRRYGLALWHAFGRGHQGLLAIKQGDVPTGLGLLLSSLDQIGGSKFAFLLRLAISVGVPAELDGNAAHGAFRRRSTPAIEVGRRQLRDTADWPSCAERV